MTMNIKQLDEQTARRICSGQVIISMSSAVKELIENSLDASATSIIIRFKEQGKDLIEVIDNGHGIDAANFPLLCKRNCTSKLSSYDHLNMVNTYGFRGQALNSLCNVCELQIHTCHSNQSIGTLINFDSNGEILSKESCARNIGTTVRISNLFKPLPVRRKELCQNVRRSFDKTLSTIYQYCIGINGFKLSCYQYRNGSYELIFNNNGHSMQSNIISIFNYKQFSNLMPFQMSDESNESNNNIDNNKVKIEGYISKPDKGCGRSQPDRQYMYVNNRPVNLPKICRLINQIYHQYNRNQYPFVVLVIQNDSKLLDLNCTPDKRTILFANHNYVQKLIENSLIKLFNRESESNQLELMTQSHLSQSMKSYLSNNSFVKSSTFSDSEDHKACESSIIDKAPNNQSNLVLINEPKPNGIQVKHPFFESIQFKSFTDKNAAKFLKSKPIESPVKRQKVCETSNNASNDNKKMKNAEPVYVEEDQLPREEIIVDIDIEDICSGYSRRHNSNATNFVDHDERIKISKELLTKSRVVGQYNLGFIIAYYENSLYVLDQHALDERFNYEKLLSNPAITKQPLVIAKQLKLSTTDELLLLDNIELFQKYGFNFHINHDRPIGQRVQLTQIPMFNDRWIANESDIEELLATLYDTPMLITNDNLNNYQFIFKRLKHSIASKACRSSIMFGDYLTMIQMKMLLAKMIDVRNPWHCAHNRPTIRHLIKIN